MDSPVEFTIGSMNEQSLQALQNEQLVTLVLALRDENEKLKNSAEKMISRKYNKRLERIEIEINRDKQYSRHDTIEIAGIDEDVSYAKIEEECIKILKAAKLKVLVLRFPLLWRYKLLNA